MKRREAILLVVGLLLIAASAVALRQFKEKQRLGLPGVKTAPIPGSVRLQIEMPTNVPGYQAEAREMDKTVVDALPADTSFGQVYYRDPTQPDGPPITVTTVLMGTDRTSIHKPQFCLPGAGWNIDDSRSALTTVHLDRPKPMDLPVMKLVATLTRAENGREVNYSGIYVYWFVAHDAVTAEHWRRMWWMTEELVKTGELQRWAYISYFLPCLPGQEDQAFARIKRLMNMTVPEFQTAWPTPAPTVAAAR